MIRDSGFELFAVGELEVDPDFDLSLTTIVPGKIASFARPFSSLNGVFPCPQTSWERRQIKIIAIDFFTF
jgi:hypothetical protein